MSIEGNIIDIESSKSLSTSKGSVEIGISGVEWIVEVKKLDELNVTIEVVEEYDNGTMFLVIPEIMGGQWNTLQKIICVL